MFTSCITGCNKGSDSIGGSESNTIGESYFALNSGEASVSQNGNSSEVESISDVLSNIDFKAYISAIYNDDENYVNQMYNYYAGVNSGNTSDLDGDGVCDDIEFQLGTDPKLVDTDGDGIDDLTELMIGLDPLQNDIKLDLDSDGLSNIEEIKYGTLLNVPDTDGDGITDYDEIYVYKTDPTLTDTDGDGISDYDELQIGLNPLVQMSDGSTKDNERVFYQVVSQDVTSKVATTDCTISATVDAGGFADRCFNVTSSEGFSYLSNTYTSVVGQVIDVNYNPDVAFTDATITFTLSDSLMLDAPIDNDIYTQGVQAYQEWARQYTDVYINSTLSGVKRYVVFEWNKEKSSLLPVNCEYDENANTITVRTTNSSGTYCIMDFYDWLHSYCNMFQ